MTKNGGAPDGGELTAPTRVRGIRGATVAAENSEEAILAATRELLYTMIRANDIRPEEVASAHFTTTVDLNATYPALAARQLGWFDVALLCGHEMNVPGGLEKCIRILIHWNTSKRAEDVVHVYLHEAQTLRPDRDNLPPVPPEEIEAAVQANAAGAADAAGAKSAKSKIR